MSRKAYKVVLCVLLVFLSACSRQKETTTDAVQSKVINAPLPVSCRPVESLIVSCKATVKTDQEAKNMLAVLSEQLQTASVVEQEKTCQDVLKFWQAACGVTQ